MTIGYLVGYGLFLMVKYWQLVYIVGYIFGLIHLMISTSYWKEKFVKDKQIKYLRKEVLFLAFSAILIRVTTYADRLLLYPILGGEQVSIYYAATVIAKVISMAINPISSVLLAYLSKINRRPNKTLNAVFLTTGIVGLLGFIIILLSSKYILQLLYPEYYLNAIKLVPYTALATVLYVMISIFNPIILKFFDMKWQIILNGSNSIIYVLISLLCLKIGGLTAFCIGIVVVNSIKLITMLFLYYTGKMRDGIVDDK